MHCHEEEAIESSSRGETAKWRLRVVSAGRISRNAPIAWYPYAVIALRKDEVCRRSRRGALPRFRLSFPCTIARSIYPNASTASSLRRNRRGRLSASTMGQPMIRSRSCASTSDALPVRCALSSRRMRAARALATARFPWRGEAISCSWTPTTSWRRAASSWRSMRPAARMLRSWCGTSGFTTTSANAGSIRRSAFSISLRSTSTARRFRGNAAPTTSS